MKNNRDIKTIEGFGEEWERFDQAALTKEEHLALFNTYFSIFPWETLPEKAVGFDLGCGSGRWAALVAPKVGVLHCIDPAEKALAMAKKMLLNIDNIHYHQATVDQIPLADNSMDFGYSLGVLHHVPDTFEGIRSCVSKLKPGAPFLVYLYYALDHRPWWFRSLFKISHSLRHIISKMPQKLKNMTCQCIAICVYYPLARGTFILEKMSVDVKNLPLSFYRDKSFFVMKTDALDRFGTRLEQRFTKDQIHLMMENAGLKDIIFSDKEPYWVAVGVKS